MTNSTNDLVSGAIPSIDMGDYHNNEAGEDIFAQPTINDATDKQSKKTAIPRLADEDRQ